MTNGQSCQSVVVGGAFNFSLLENRGKLWTSKQRSLKVKSFGKTRNRWWTSKTVCRQGEGKKSEKRTKLEKIAKDNRTKKGRTGVGSSWRSLSCNAAWRWVLKIISDFNVYRTFSALFFFVFQTKAVLLSQHKYRQDFHRRLRCVLFTLFPNNRHVVVSSSPFWSDYLPQDVQMLCSSFFPCWCR